MASSRGLAALLLAGATSMIPAAAHAVPGQDPSAPPTPAPATSSAVGQAAPGVRVPNFATRAWVLADLDTGEILAQLNPHMKLRPASTQKLLTALTVAPRLHPDQLYRADKGDETAEGNRVVLYDGLTYKISDLLHAALLPSANDAAMALAKANGGAARTVAQMNEEAARLGATDTTAVNPSGLDADGQFTSANDLATIGRAAFTNPEIASYLKLATVDFPGKATGPDSRVIYPIYNHNTMLRDGFQGALGGKSGYTTLARRTMVAAAQRDGHRLVVSAMDIGGNTYRTAEHLLDWGFAHRAELSPVGHLPEPVAPAPTFDRTIVDLATGAPAGGDVGGGSFGDPGAHPAADDSVAPAPPAPARTHGTSGTEGGGYWPLTVLTILVGLLAAARARVYWLTCQRDRAAAERARRAARTERMARAAARERSHPDERDLADSRV